MQGNAKRTATLVKARLTELNKMAHPSDRTFQQTVGATENAFKLGANYKRDLCVSVLHEGASGLQFILQALDHVFPQPSEWRTTLQLLIDDHEAIRSREERSRLSNVSGKADH